VEKFSDWQQKPTQCPYFSHNTRSQLKPEVISSFTEPPVKNILKNQKNRMDPAGIEPAAFTLRT
jgi:hypothetical protein